MIMSLNWQSGIYLKLPVISVAAGIAQQLWKSSYLNMELNIISYLNMELEI